MSSASDKDLGPLVWVKGEIDLALARALEALHSPDAGAEQIRFAQTHLHQARGALSIVGLDGLTQFSDTLEALLADWHGGRLAEPEAAGELAGRAIAAIRSYLDDLIAGEADQPLRLSGLYGELMAARGESRVSRSELFFPDLTQRPPALAVSAPTPSPLEAGQQLRLWRGAFERGLLRWLRDPADRQGLALMLDAVRNIEQTQPLPSARAFWWVTGAVLEGLANGAIQPDLDVKRLCGRIDAQIRRLLEGSRVVAERIMRDALYLVATASRETPRIRKVRDTYRLMELLPDEAGGSVSVEPLRPVLAVLRDTLASAKDAWNRFAAGAAVGLPHFHEQAEQMALQSQVLNQPELTRLMTALRDTGQWLRRDPLQQSEQVAMEVATALLLLETLLDQFSRRGMLESGHQVDTVIDRLERMRAGESLEALQAPMFDDMTRRAQEKLFMSQLVREIQTNLSDIEQTLDGFFRDPQRQAELTRLGAPLKQVEGALSILGQDNAVALVRECAGDIERFARSDFTAEDGEFEDLAHKLSGLGFFIEKLQHGSADLQAILSPRSNDAAVEEGGANPAATVESQLEQSRHEAAQLIDQIKDAPARAELRDELKQNLESIRQDAKLVADARLEQQASQALAALAASPDSDTAAESVQAAVETLASRTSDVPAPSAETVRLAEASSEELDAELLSIFIEEAQEVLATMQGHVEASRAQPHNQDLLTTLRRGFHTLKGSGRMVGLRDLGEAAFAVEQVFNKWLQLERDATEALYDLVDKGRGLFLGWVDRLQAGDTASPDFQWLLDLAEQVKEGRTPAIDLDTECEVASAAASESETPAPPTPEWSAEVSDVYDTSLEATDVVFVQPDAALDYDIGGGAQPVVEPESLDLDIDFSEAPGVALAPPAAGPFAELSMPASEADAAGPQPVLDLEMTEQDAMMATALYDVTQSPVDYPLDTDSAPAPSLDFDLQTQLAPEALLSDIDAPGMLETAVLPPGEVLDLEAGWSLAGETPVMPISEPESPASTFADTPVPTQQDSASATVDVGGQPVDAELFELFVLEARGHVATLRRELARLHVNPALLPGQDSVLAAHTLGGIARTMGFDPISALSRALEHALSRVEASRVPPSADQSSLLNTAAATLESQVAAIGDRRAAQAADSLVEELESVGLSPAGMVDLDESPEAANEADDTIPLLEMPQTSSTFDAPAAIMADAANEDAAATQDEPLAAPALASPPEIAPQETVSVGEALILSESGAAGWEELSLPELLSRPSAPVATERRKHRPVDDVDPQLLPIFLEEARDLLDGISRALRAWREHPGEEAPAADLQRLLHTLKGSARMAGIMSFGEHVHDMEGRLVQALSQGAPDDSGFDEIDNDFDQCELFMERLERGEPLAGKPSAAEVETDAPAVESGEDEEATTGARERPMVRVRADLVDRFVNEAGEMSISRARVEGELRALRASLSDLTENVGRLRNQLREIEIQAESQMQSRLAAAEAQHEQFDPLEMDRFTRFQELSRMMAESLGDVTTVHYNLVRNLDAADTAIHAQARLNRDLSHALMSVRMVPFSTLEDRLYRVARQAGKESGKKVNLEIRNGQIELDREVLEKMTGPVEHLLRNAVVHGIEAREVREAMGKPELGDIAITLTQEANEVRIELADDGAGLNFERIRERGIERGLLAPEEAVDERRLTDLIFASGFTTAEQLSELAGRGVGMDVVRNETTSLGGRIEVSSQAGVGARFSLTLPMTLAVTQCVLVSSGGKTYAIPSTLVQHAHEMKPDAAASMRADGGVDWMDHRYGYRYLPRLLGDGHSQPDPLEHSWQLLLRGGNEFMALEVDRLIGNQEIVVKPIGPQLSRLAGISGATVLADGEVTLIINPVGLIGRAERVLAGMAQARPQAEPAGDHPVIMVVDDSLTVRRVATRLLERENYRVITAKDGVDALEKLLEVVPQVMLVDIEMPRMDGFDLTRNVRADVRLKHVPIVMITSRTADKHKAYAREIGVNHYLGKPYDETELLGIIAGYVRPSTSG